MTLDEMQSLKDRLADVEKACDYYRSAFLQHARPPIDARPRFIPSRVRLATVVRGDFPFNGTMQRAGDHDCECNGYGAVSVRATNGKVLGLRPGEFEPLEWVENPRWKAGDA